MFVHDAGPQALVQYSHLYNYTEARNDLENTAFLFNGRRYAFEVQFSKLHELVIHKASNYSRDFELHPMKPDPVHISERIPSSSDRFSGYPSRDPPLRSAAPRPAAPLPAPPIPYRHGSSAQPATPSEAFYSFSAGSQIVSSGNSNGNGNGNGNGNSSGSGNGNSSGNSSAKESRTGGVGPNPRRSSGVGAREAPIDGSSFLQRPGNRSEGRLVHYATRPSSFDPIPQAYDPFPPSHDPISDSYTSMPSQSYPSFPPPASQSFDLLPPSRPISQPSSSSLCPPFYPDVPRAQPSFQPSSSIASSTSEPLALGNFHPSSAAPRWQNDFAWRLSLPSRPLQGLRRWVIEGFAQEVPLSELVDFLYGIHIVFAEFSRQRMGYSVVVFGVSEWSDAMIADYLSQCPVNGRVVHLQGPSQTVNF